MAIRPGVRIALLLLGLGARARAGEAGEASPAPAAMPPAPVPQIAPAAPTPEPLATEITTVHEARRLPLGLGLGTLGISYAVKLLGSLVLVGTANVDGPCNRCRQEAGELLIPIAGPLLVANAEDPNGHSSTGWAVAAAWSVAEATAVTLTIIGIIGHDVPAQRGRPSSPPVTLVPAVTRGRGALALNVAW